MRAITAGHHGEAYQRSGSCQRHAESFGCERLPTGSCANATTVVRPRSEHDRADATRRCVENAWTRPGRAVLEQRTSGPRSALGPRCSGFAYQQVGTSCDWCAHSRALVAVEVSMTLTMAPWSRCGGHRRRDCAPTFHQKLNLAQPIRLDRRGHVRSTRRAERSGCSRSIRLPRSVMCLG